MDISPEIAISDVGFHVNGFIPISQNYETNVTKHTAVHRVRCGNYSNNTANHFDIIVS